MSHFPPAHGADPKGFGTRPLRLPLKDTIYLFVLVHGRTATAFPTGFSVCKLHCTLCSLGIRLDRPFGIRVWYSDYSDHVPTHFLDWFTLLFAATSHPATPHPATPLPAIPYPAIPQERGQIGGATKELTKQKVWKSESEVAYSYSPQ